MRHLLALVFIIFYIKAFSQNSILRDTTVTCYLAYYPHYYHSGYNMSKRKKQKLIDKYEKQILLNEKGYELKIYKFLKENNRIDSPYVLFDSKYGIGKIKFWDEILYIDSINYEKLKIYKYSELKKNKQKVEFTFKAKYSFDNVFIFTEFVELKLIPCDCYNEKEDFKRLNYK